MAVPETNTIHKQKRSDHNKQLSGLSNVCHDRGSEPVTAAVLTRLSINSGYLELR